MGPGFPEKPADPPLGHGIKSGGVEGLPIRRAVPEHDGLGPRLPVREGEPPEPAAPRSPPAGETTRLRPGGLAQRTAPLRHRIDEEGQHRQVSEPRRPRGLAVTEGGYPAIPWVLQGVEGFVLNPPAGSSRPPQFDCVGDVTSRSVTEAQCRVRPSGRTAQPARPFPSPSTFASFSGPPLRHRQRNRWPPRVLSTRRVAAVASTQRHPSPWSPGFPPSTDRRSRSSSPRMGGPFEASASSPTSSFRGGCSRRPSRRRWVAARSPSCWRDPSARRIGSGASGHPSRGAGCPPPPPASRDPRSGGHRGEAAHRPDHPAPASMSTIPSRPPTAAGRPAK